VPRDKRFVGLVLTERQAKSLLVYGRMMRDHGAGSTIAKDFRAICAKLDRSLRRLDNGTSNVGATKTTTRA
jgi:hypothetical protein